MILMRLCFSGTAESWINILLYAMEPESLLKEDLLMQKRSMVTIDQ